MTKLDVKKYEAIIDKIFTPEFLISLSESIKMCDKEKTNKLAQKMFKLAGGEEPQSVIFGCSLVLLELLSQIGYDKIIKEAKLSSNIEVA